GVPIDRQHDAHAVVDELHVRDAAHRDPAVGDLGVDEDAAGVAEVGGDVVAAAEDHPVQADVLEAEVGHGHHGQGHEGDQLEPGAPGDHFDPPVVSGGN